MASVRTVFGARSTIRISTRSIAGIGFSSKRGGWSEDAGERAFPQRLRAAARP
jgi:hypothetical protein